MTCPRRTMRRRRGGGQEGEEEEDWRTQARPLGPAWEDTGKYMARALLPEVAPIHCYAACREAAWPSDQGPQKRPRRPQPQISYAPSRLSACRLAGYAGAPALTQCAQLSSCGPMADAAALACAASAPACSRQSARSAACHGSSNGFVCRCTRVDARTRGCTHARHTYIHTACRVGTASTHGCTASRPP